MPIHPQVLSWMLSVRLLEQAIRAESKDRRILWRTPVQGFGNMAGLLKVLSCCNGFAFIVGAHAFKLSLPRKQVVD